eukprot:PhM_4_TR9485/c0_g1_i1/m.82681
MLRRPRHVCGRRKALVQRSLPEGHEQQRAVLCAQHPVVAAGGIGAAHASHDGTSPVRKRNRDIPAPYAQHRCCRRELNALEGVVVLCAAYHQVIGRTDDGADVGDERGGSLPHVNLRQSILELRECDVWVASWPTRRLQDGPRRIHRDRRFVAANHKRALESVVTYVIPSDNYEDITNKVCGRRPSHDLISRQDRSGTRLCKVVESEPRQRAPRRVQDDNIRPTRCNVHVAGVDIHEAARHSGRLRWVHIPRDLNLPQCDEVRVHEVHESRLETDGDDTVVHARHVVHRSHGKGEVNKTVPPCESAAVHRDDVEAVCAGGRNNDAVAWMCEHVHDLARQFLQHKRAHVRRHLAGLRGTERHLELLECASEFKAHVALIQLDTLAHTRRWRTPAAVRPSQFGPRHRLDVALSSFRDGHLRCGGKGDAVLVHDL